MFATGIGLVIEGIRRSEIQSNLDEEAGADKGKTKGKGFFGLGGSKKEKSKEYIEPGTSFLNKIKAFFEDDPDMRNSNLN